MTHFPFSVVAEIDDDENKINEMSVPWAWGELNFSRRCTVYQWVYDGGIMGEKSGLAEYTPRNKIL